MAGLDHRYAVERLLEEPALTGDLVDPAAHMLLHWAVGRVGTVLAEMADEPPREVTRELAALRRVVRRIGRLAAQAAPERQEQRLERVLSLLNVVSREESDEPTV